MPNYVYVIYENNVARQSPFLGHIIIVRIICLYYINRIFNTLEINERLAIFATAHEYE